MWPSQYVEGEFLFVVSTGRKNITILVNLKECMFQFYKPGDSQRSTYTHNQLLQLVKSRSRDTRLSVVFQGQSRKEYIFNDMQVCGGARLVLALALALAAMLVL